MIIHTTPGGKKMKTELAIRLAEELSRVTNVDSSYLKNIIEIVLDDYQVTKCETALAVISSDLQEKIFLYLACRKQDGLSKKTLKNYKSSLIRFAETISKRTEDITTIDIRKYLMVYEQLVNPCSGTLAGELTKIKSFFNWLSDQDYIPKSPAKNIPAIKTDSRMRKPLSPEELEMLRDNCKTYRDRALVETFYSTGGRLDEIVKLNRDDIDWQTLSLKVIGKGNKEREVYLSPKAKVHLRKYLLSRTDENEALFVSERKPHDRLGNRAIQKVIGDLGIKARLKRKIYPHLLRHTVATDMLNNGADLITVQKYLGHEDPATTQIYAKLNKEEVKIAHRKFVQ